MIAKSRFLDSPKLILKNLTRLTIDKQMKMQYILTELYLVVEYNVNELLLMTHISTAQQVELKTFWGVDLI